MDDRKSTAGKLEGKGILDSSVSQRKSPQSAPGMWWCSERFHEWRGFDWKVWYLSSAYWKVELRPDNTKATQHSIIKMLLWLFALYILKKKKKKFISKFSKCNLTREGNLTLQKALILLDTVSEQLSIYLFLVRYADFETFLRYSKWKLSPEFTDAHFTYVIVYANNKGWGLGKRREKFLVSILASRYYSRKKRTTGNRHCLIQLDHSPNYYYMDEK